VPDAVDGRLRDRRFRRRLLGEVADVVARLHGAGFYHRDLYLSHFFLDDGADGDVGLTLIDLQRMIAPRMRRRRWIVKDLAALDYSTPAGAVSVRDRLRWYRRYRGVARLSREDRALLRAVAAKRRRIARHSAKHGLG
jgi:heptose I phosphotransferase